MGENAFRNASQGLGRGDCVTGLGDGGELPLAIRFQAFDVFTGLEEEAELFSQSGQRVLHTIVDLAQQARSEFDREHLVAELDRVADL